ncbi:TlpA disulfide reductase family protein [Pricia sp. S334]|uniref:TlpA disulfide reductase family protein n=1 Tax=Pricia mediterranea TaxID=3076079 RepID=A0ABU3L306_9FLAO|nr:TlpA disulfide reductase family protein [Pricia sp. S334]MDT7827472.1 TlpA disulfide reductase family protein [Pricia sp. S334]
MDKDQRKSWIQYGVITVVAITLYVTGLHTEVIGFAQRGLLATGLMNPDVEHISQAATGENINGKSTSSDRLPVDFNLNLIDANGATKSLEELRGKVIFINKWATWCPPCIAEMPSIDKLHETIGDEVAFVMLSLDEDFEKAKAFDKRKGYGLPIYTLASSLPSMFRSSAIPTTYVIDADGNVALEHEGMADYNTKEFKAFLRGLK